MKNVHFLKNASQSKSQCFEKTVVSPSSPQLLWNLRRLSKAESLPKPRWPKVPQQPRAQN